MSRDIQTKISQGRSEIDKLKSEISKMDKEIENKTNSKNLETKASPVTEKPEPKLTKWERTKNFWNVKKRLTPMFLDYKRVCLDFGRDFPKNKIYYSSRFLLTGAFIYGVMTVPNREDHSRKILTMKHKMLDYGTNRNPNVNAYVQRMVTKETRGTLSYEDFWLFSVVRENIYPTEAACSEAVYSKLSHRWYNPVSYWYSVPEYFRSIVDIGVFGNFLAMEMHTGDHNLPDVDLVNQMNRLHRRPDSNEYYPDLILDSDNLQNKTLKTGKQVLNMVRFKLLGEKCEQIPLNEQRSLDITDDEW